MQSTSLHVRTGPPAHALWRNGLLCCGIVASVLYVGADILAAARWEAYSYAHQTVSELMAIDAPTRPLLLALFSLYDLLMAAFAVGVWAAAGGSRALRVAGALLFAWTAVGLGVLLFGPMHLRGAGFSATDVLHITGTGVAAVLLLLAIGFAAAALGRGFLLYSVATIAVLLGFGALVGRLSPGIAAGLPTPWIGLLERVNIYGTMLWLVVLAVVLLRRRARAS